MIAVLALLCGLGATLLAIPALVLLAEVLLARHDARADGLPGDPGGTDGAATGHGRPRLAVLVPAHDEAAGIAGTLDSIRRQLAPGDRVLVVADNCRDDTAARARAAGAQVTERFDDVRRGKGFALAHGVAHLAADAPEVVVIVDADCTLGERALDRLARLCAATGRPVQARYLMRYPPGVGGLSARIAEFAFRMKNRVRPLGAARLGAPCPLFGSGMAFPWPLIANAPLANGNIVEDMKLGVDLALAGHGALYCDAASVDSFFPATTDGQASQRTRWEHGHLQTLRTEVPRLAVRGLAGDGRCLAMALDLAVPPLSLLVMLQAAALAFALAAWLAGGGAWPAAIALAGCVACATAVLLAWRRFARDVLPLAQLAGVPAYALRKLGLYRRFAVNRQTTWVRSRRDQE